MSLSDSIIEILSFKTVMAAISNQPNIWYLLSRNLRKVVLDRSDIRSVISSDKLSMTIYLDFVQFNSDGNNLSFLKKLPASGSGLPSSGNHIFQFRRQNWSKPAVGLKCQSSMRGHLYYVGQIHAKYDVHLSFKPNSGACDCKVNNDELHVHPTISDIIAEGVHCFLSQYASALTGYYSGSKNLYKTQEKFDIPLRDFLKNDLCQFPNLVGHTFFETHKMCFLVTCIGQNDEIENVQSLFGEIGQTFNFSEVFDLRMSLAYSVSVIDGDQRPLSVVIEKEQFDTDMLNGLSNAKFYHKCFSTSFTNFQSESFPISLSNSISVFNNEAMNSTITEEKLNFYNGKTYF